MMPSIRQNQIQGLVLVLVYALLEVTTTASVVPKKILPTSRGNGLLKAGPIASSMNGLTFLQELVALKAATNTEYKMSRPLQQQNRQRKKINGHSFRILDCLSSSDTSNSMRAHMVASCEYSGDLWFLPRGVKFRETVLVKGISDDEKRAIVECSSDYHNGKRWVRCVKTTCEIDTTTIATIDNDESDTVGQLRMAVSSNVKVRLPVPGINGKIERMINSTFQNALVAFVRNYHGIESNSFILV